MLQLSGGRLFCNPVEPSVYLLLEKCRWRPTATIACTHTPSLFKKHWPRLGRRYRINRLLRRPTEPPITAPGETQKSEGSWLHRTERRTCRGQVGECASVLLRGSKRIEKRVSVCCSCKVVGHQAQCLQF